MEIIASWNRPLYGGVLYIEVKVLSMRLYVESVEMTFVTMHSEPQAS